MKQLLERWNQFVDETSDKEYPRVIINKNKNRDLGLDALANITNITASRLPQEARYGPRKVFISRIYDEIMRRGKEYDFTLDEYKTWLLNMNRLGLIRLSRADLVGAMNMNDVNRSEIHSGYATFHFVEDQNAPIY